MSRFPRGDIVVGEWGRSGWVSLIGGIGRVVRAR